MEFQGQIHAAQNEKTRQAFPSQRRTGHPTDGIGGTAKAGAHVVALMSAKMRLSPTR